MNISIDDKFDMELFDLKPSLEFNFTNRIYSKYNFQLFEKFSKVLKKFVNNTDDSLRFKDLVHIHSDLFCFEL